MTISCLCGVILFAGIGSPALARGSQAQLPAEVVLPDKALLVFTRESWGCMEGQIITEDVTSLLSESNAEKVLLQDVKNPDDVNNRYEIYLYFPAPRVSARSGYDVLRLSVVGSDPQLSGFLRLAQAALVRTDKSLTFILKAKIEGFLKADLLYAVGCHLKTGLFACPAADLFEPHPVRFLDVYPVRTEMASTAAKMDAQWDQISLPIESSLQKEGDDVAACIELLNGLEESFSGSKEFVFQWDQSKITQDGLSQIASSFEKDNNLKYHVNVEIIDKQGKTEIRRDVTSFVPKLQQIIAIRSAHGKMISGMVKIGIEKCMAR
jgi:hypothetical protein